MANPISQPPEKYQSITDLNELKPGMVIAEDIVNQRGNVLIASGFVVEDTRKLIQFLTLHKVEGLKVRLKPTHTATYPAGTNGSALADPTIKTDEPSVKQASPAKPDLSAPKTAPVTAPDTATDTAEAPLPPVTYADPAIIQAEEERKVRQRRIKETKAFQDRYYEQREAIKSDFEKIVHGDPVTREEMEDRVVGILKSFDSIINVFQLIESIKKDARDLFAHYYHVTLISHYIGTWLNFTPTQMKDLTLSALLHDIGKEQISPELILKRHDLSHDEQLEYQKHVVLGYELVKKYDFITHDMMQAILLHHERSDGSGYPLGLKQDKIPILARVIAVADVYNSLTMANGVEKRRTPFEAVKILESEYMDKLDTRILYIFLNRIGNCFLGQEVKLSDQRVGEIIFVPRIYIYRPIVKLKNNNQLIDLSRPENNKLYIHSFS
ncbi:HD-GYP domain-containing protein [Anoxynatronum buryatiense]|uniref:HD-GYP domain, c-di-GMP phosphodiesterase class II (Or its inactivated variant) n=1 Tax=Anoxynatronum buryatiense TaxID=489973 RepID=A0AA45WW83_9CLOT|nr:HD domain-containing phosphohydrolase [Anoxynatronum buryatiense]SMP56136.1 HD-GYP domain, c-di-GMP phosphodiesterase class II (or its inactivated variant) [Anoxynatronum buryatiense]